MADIKILSEAELRDLVPLDLSTIDCVEAGFAALARGGVEMPPILSMEVHESHGEVDVKTAHITGAESFTIKLATGFFDNPKIGLPASSGIMVVFSAKTGQVEAVLLDNGYLTDTRTAAAGAIAARHLARADATRLCVFGAGVQARMQAAAIHLVRPLTRVDVWARDAGKANAAAADIAAQLGVDARAVPDRQTAVRAADITVTTTPAKEPLVMAGWMEKGQLLIAMGSDQPGKFEVDPALLASADHYIPDRLSQTLRQGELAAAIAAGAVQPGAAYAELGDVVTGKLPGYDAAQSLTICDLTGTGVQDTAIATLARQRAAKAGSGTSFSS